MARSANTGPVETTSACSCNLVRGRSRAPPRRSRDPSCRAGVTLISPEAPRSTSPPRPRTSPPWRQGGPRRDSGLGCATLVLGPVLARSTSTLGARHGDVETSPCRSRTGRLVAAVARHSPTTSAGRGRAPTNRATTQRPRPIGPPFSGLDRALLNGHPAGSLRAELLTGSARHCGTQRASRWRCSTGTAWSCPSTAPGVSSDSSTVARRTPGWATATWRSALGQPMRASQVPPEQQTSCVLQQQVVTRSPECPHEP